jgi:hypothetical protein
MAGKATFTTNVSIMSMPSPRQTATRVDHFEAVSGAFRNDAMLSSAATPA